MQGLGGALVTPAGRRRVFWLLAPLAAAVLLALPATVPATVATQRRAAASPGGARVAVLAAGRRAPSGRGARAALGASP